MKKTLILVAMAFLLIGAVAVAEEAVILDFQLLNADIIADKAGAMTQNRRTVMDYGAVAGASYTDEQKALMRSSLAIAQWEVKLNSSAQNPTSVALSKVTEAEVSGEAKNFAGQKLMGVRILFPTWANNANAEIRPGFLIPAYEKMTQVDDSGNLQEPTEEDKASGKGRFEGGYGVVRNTGVIKSIAVNTYGMNFPHGLYVLLRDQNNKVTRYFMGYLLFDGWREMIWSNPGYITQVKAREVRLYPVYPTSLPHVSFDGFLVTRDAAHDGGDFVGYFKDVKIIYDKAVLTTVRDFADEDIWGIQTEREMKRKKIEVERFGQTQVLRFLEQEKMATEAGFTPSEGSEAAKNSGNNQETNNQ
ncbi:flagellar filament outer layer protein FlaA [Treponema pedis]|uniref:Flagellar filament outer layer protein n=1 Tax=Treponema pedis str. T A4 TaxID=1291379 RepID=S6A3W7_9SPIR|nr:flagellar filament outer layer protein FlaA [Treponema pedis]AGT43916.1 flagellar filament outer layer protein [Treponema pedis str. T A4]